MLLVKPIQKSIVSALNQPIFASHRRLDLYLRFKPVFCFFRSKIPSQTKPRTTTTSIGRIVLNAPKLLGLSPVVFIP